MPRIVTTAAVVATLLATRGAAFDIQYCHGGYTSGVCQGLSLSSAAPKCYSLNVSGPGPIDAVVGITAGITYTLYTGAGCTGTASSVFAVGSNTLTAPFLNNVLSLSAQLPSAWQSLGCYTDTAGGRTLAASSASSQSLTAESCQTFCSASGYNYAGVEYGNECYCDYSLRPPGVIAADPTSCSMPCVGNALEKCGGPNRINVYWNGKPGPTNAATLGGGTFAYRGCYTDNADTRVLTARFEFSGGATPDKCAAICKGSGYPIMGLEYGLECWCGNQLSSLSTKVTDDNCRMACKGNTTSYCGDAYRLNIWSKSPL